MMTRLPGVAKQHPPDTFSVLAYAGTAVAFVGQEVTSRMDLSAKRHARMAVQRPRLSFMTGVLFTGIGLVFLVAATLRAGVLPRWCGFELLALVVFWAFGASYGVSWW
jgi:hypothetical protein